MEWVGSPANAVDRAALWLLLRTFEVTSLK